MNNQNDNQANSFFNFDEWMQLAEEDPQAFEEKRQVAIFDVIDNASTSSKRRLQGLQWQIDKVSKQSGNRIASCLKISQMMWVNVQGEDGLLEKLNQLIGQASIIQKEKKSAEIVNLQAATLDASEKQG